MMRSRVSLSIVSLVLSGAPLAAQIVPIMNASFDTNVAGWVQSPDGAAFQTAPDVDGCPGGKAVLFNDFDQVIKLRQCLLLSGSQSLSVTVWTHGDGSDVESLQILKVSFFSDTACSAFLDNSTAFASSTPWTRLAVEVTSPPGGTNSIEISLEVVENGASAAYAAFDEVRVARNGLIFADGFEAGSPCRFSGEFP